MYRLIAQLIPIAAVSMAVSIALPDQHMLIWTYRPAWILKASCFTMEVDTLFQQWLHQHYPLKAEHVMNRIRDCQGGKSYRAGPQRMTGQSVFAELLHQRYQLMF